MENRLRRGGWADNPDANGFSLTEVLISITILGILTSMTVYTLRSTQYKDELGTAARVVTADLRSLQARALTAQNIRSCMDVNLKRAVCELGTNVCAPPGTCDPLPPSAVGFFTTTGTSIYQWFADVEPAKSDGKKTDDSEIFFMRDLRMAGAPNVVIDQLITVGDQKNVHVAFLRQNGSAGINGCFTNCPGPFILRLRLRHTVTNEIQEISLNALSGRVSF